MFLREQNIKELSKMQALKVLSLCHPQINGTLLNYLRAPSLERLTIFCANNINSFVFMQQMAQLKAVCFYRCALDVLNLHKVAELKPNIQIRLFGPRQMRQRGLEIINTEKHPNISFLQLMRRPYPVFA